MNKQQQTLVLLGGLAVLAYFFTKKASAAEAPGSTTSTPPTTYNTTSVANPVQAPVPQTTFQNLLGSFLSQPAAPAPAPAADYKTATMATATQESPPHLADQAPLAAANPAPSATPEISGTSSYLITPTGPTTQEVLNNYLPPGQNLQATGANQFGSSVGPSSPQDVQTVAAAASAYGYPVPMIGGQFATGPIG